MPPIREPRTAEARAHRDRIAAVLEAVAQTFGGQHQEVFSPDFMDLHKKGDLWFCTVCFAPLSCAADGSPKCSNNGMERDCETPRWTVECENVKLCKKRQCRAIKLSFPTPMNEVTLTRLISTMRKKSTEMERALGFCAMPSERRRSPYSKESMRSSGSSNAKKGSKFTKATKGGLQKMANGASPAKAAKGDFKCNLPSTKALVNGTMEVSKGSPAATVTTKVLKKTPASMEVLNGKAQLSPIRSCVAAGSKLTPIKLPPLSLGAIAEALLDLSDRIPLCGVDCSSTKMWKTFENKTRMCKTAKELLQQATWLMGQFKPAVLKPEWKQSGQAEWKGECCHVGDLKHCKQLIEHLGTHAINWEAVDALWSSEGALEEKDRDDIAGSSPRSICVARRLQSTQSVSNMRWKSDEPVRLNGWLKPKIITFVLGAEGQGLQISTNTGMPVEAADYVPAGAKEDVKEVQGKLDWKEVPFGKPEGLDSPQSLWTNFDDNSDCVGVKQDRFFDDPMTRRRVKDLAPLSIPSWMKSPVFSPSLKPLDHPYGQTVDRSMVDIEACAIDLEEYHQVAVPSAGCKADIFLMPAEDGDTESQFTMLEAKPGLVGVDDDQADSDFDKKSAELDMQGFCSLSTSSMSTEHDYADFPADLVLTDWERDIEA